MKNPILTIMKKELARFFGDKKLIVSILLPGILIYVMYTFMGSAMSDMFTTEETYIPQVAVMNLPASLEGSDSMVGVAYTAFDNAEDLKNSVQEQICDAGVVFPENFDEAIASYDVASGTVAPNVEVYYNTSSTNSQTAYNLMISLLDSYESALSNKFDINASYDPDSADSYDMAEAADLTASIFSMMMPVLLIMFLFTGCMAVAPESIAGEKERGTLYTILVTPLKRTHLAIGKIAALAVVALFSGASSFIGTMLALPKLMGGMDDSVSAALYSVVDYVFIALVIFSTVLLIITLISIISAGSKSVKEAQTMISPLMIVVILIAVLSMINDGGSSPALCFIPLYNSILCMSDVFAFACSPVNILITVISNIIYTGAGVFVLSRMFASEKVMFAK